MQLLTLLGTKLTAANHHQPPTVYILQVSAVLHVIVTDWRIQRELEKHIFVT